MVAVGIGLCVLPRVWGLLKETLNVLLEGVPEGIDLDAVAAALNIVPGVRNVHDLHVWAISSDSPSMSAHVVLAEGVDGESVRAAAADVLGRRFHIAHVTLQMETSGCRLQREQHDLH